jgi:hypothetical protein
MKIYPSLVDLDKKLSGVADLAVIPLIKRDFRKKKIYTVKALVLLKVVN